MNLLSYGEAHRRTNNEAYWVIEYNSARQERCERLPMSTHDVAFDETWLIIYPSDRATQPVRYVPAHRIGEFSCYPEVTA